MPGPLTGYRIVDLTSNVAGPLATMILADQGADVIKIEAPDGGAAPRAGARPPAWGRGAGLRLAAGADVFVQNFRPGVADRLGVGEEPVRAVSPKIVYVSIRGCGAEGPYGD